MPQSITQSTNPLLLFLLSLTLHAQASTPLIPHAPNFSSLPAHARVEQISNTPYILCIHNFISDEEAEFLKKVSQPLLKKSLVVGSESISIDHPGRTSSSAFLHTVKSAHITNISKRAADFINAQVNQVEGLQVVHYKDFQKYDPHYDFFDRSRATVEKSIGNRGQRVATFLVYLNDTQAQAGGETFFPKVGGGLKIKPQKNMAVFWFNVLPNGVEDKQTLHGGLPISMGEKYAMNIWIRDPRLINQPKEATTVNGSSTR